MGDGCDYNDVERFMRSPEGKKCLGTIRSMVIGKTVQGVTFENMTHAVATVLHFDDGTVVTSYEPLLCVEAVRAYYGGVLGREYRVDYPGRDP